MALTTSLNARIAEVTAICMHEARHAEQTFMVAAQAAVKRPLTAAEATLIRVNMVGKWLDLRLALADLWQVTGKAYAAYPNEADSYVIQAEAQKLFLAKP